MWKTFKEIRPIYKHMNLFFTKSPQTGASQQDAVYYILVEGVSFVCSEGFSVLKAPIKKRNFKDLTNQILTDITLLNAGRTIMKKMNVLFIVHFCLGKYSLSFDIF